MRLTEALRMIWQCRWSHCMKIHCGYMYNTSIYTQSHSGYVTDIDIYMYIILEVKQGQLVNNEYTNRGWWERYL